MLEAEQQAATIVFLAADEAASTARYSPWTTGGCDVTPGRVLHVNRNRAEILTLPTGIR